MVDGERGLIPLVEGVTLLVAGLELGGRGDGAGRGQHERGDLGGALHFESVRTRVEGQENE